MAARIRVLLIDDHADVAQALALRLRAEPALEVLPPTAEPEAALEMVMRQQPAVALVEIRRRDGRGLAIISALTRACPTLSIMVLTSYASEWEAWAVRQAGARDCVLKDIGTEALVEKIKAVAGSG